MKLAIFFILPLLICCTPGKQTIASHQEGESILIKHNCKIAEHGYFTFLYLDEGKAIKEKVYSYSINKKNREVHVGILRIDDVDSDFDYKNFYDEKQWRKRHIGSFREKLFNVIHEGYLDLSNHEKIKVLDSLVQE